MVLAPRAGPRSPQDRPNPGQDGPRSTQDGSKTVLKSNFFAFENCVKFGLVLGSLFGPMLGPKMKPKKDALEDRLGAVLGRSWVVLGEHLGSFVVFLVGVYRCF